MTHERDPNPDDPAARDPVVQRMRDGEGLSTRGALIGLLAAVVLVIGLVYLFGNRENTVATNAPSPPGASDTNTGTTGTAPSTTPAPNPADPQSTPQTEPQR